MAERKARLHVFQPFYCFFCMRRGLLGVVADYLVNGTAVCRRHADDAAGLGRNVRRVPRWRRANAS